jgi:hypothetical protein
MYAQPQSAVGKPREAHKNHLFCRVAHNNSLRILHGKMSHRVNSPERRSFVFHEVPQLRSDFDPVIQPRQESAADRLLGRDGQERNTDERTRASASLHQLHPNGSFVYSDDEQSRSPPLDETTNKHLAQAGTCSVPSSEKVNEPVYWKGNTPWALTWEFLGIVVSVCFLSRSCVRYVRSTANV